MSPCQIVPPAFFGRQIVPDDKMSHFLPMRQIVPATKCPISSPATKCPTDDPTEKPLFHWHFSGDKLSQGDKMSHFLPGDKMSQLMHLCTGKLWKVVGTFCRLSHFVNLKANTLGKASTFSKHVLDISWLHSDYILATIWLHFLLHLGYISATFWLHSAYIPTNSDYILATF